MLFNFSKLKNFDWTLLLIVALLACLGLAIIYSVTLAQEQPDYSLLQKQVFFFAAGLILLFIFAFVDYRMLGSLAVWIYLFSILLLIAVLFFGTAIRGTRGWFSVFGLGFQPAEVAKLALVVFLAKFLGTGSEERLPFKIVITCLLVAALPIALIVFQPDFGSAMVLLLCTLGLVWLAGLPKKYLYVLLVILVLALAVGWFFLMQAYQKERIINFLNPAHDPLGQGYNVIQSVIAIGSGGWMGRGLGLGPQSQLNFLPETAADFIFASLGEELGFLGVFLILALYLLFFWRAYKITKIVRDNFSLLLVLGMLLIFSIQIIINIGMAIGFLPVTGLPLPFISSGGSFLIISMICVGILESVVIRNKGVV